MVKDLMKKPWLLTLTVVVTLGIMMVPEFAFAINTIGNVLCTVVGWFTGRVGKAVATLAIIVIGIGALMGKVSWGMAIIVGVGVAVVFGAETIVEELGTNFAGGCAA